MSSSCTQLTYPSDFTPPASCAFIWAPVGPVQPGNDGDANSVTNYSPTTTVTSASAAVSWDGTTTVTRVYTVEGPVAAVRYTSSYYRFLGENLYTYSASELRPGEADCLPPQRPNQCLHAYTRGDCPISYTGLRTAIQGGTTTAYCCPIVE
jgi:hypothetical protein